MRSHIAMKKEGKWRTLALWALVVFSICYSLPTLMGGSDKLPDWFTDIFDKELNYGLDLQGGLELRYTVDWKKAIEDNARKLGETVRASVVDELAKADNKDADSLPQEEWNKYGAQVEVEVPDYTTIRVRFLDDATAKAMPADELEKLDYRFEVISTGERQYDMILLDEEVARIRDQAVKETQTIIRERVEAFGLVDPDVRVAGEADIAVQIPGVKKEQMDTVRQRIGQTAQLTLRMVDRQATFFAGQQGAADTWKQTNPDSSIRVVGSSSTGPYVRADRKGELVQFIKTLAVPDDHVIGYENIVNLDPENPENFWRTHYLHAKVEIDGSHLSRALVLYDEKNQPYVNLAFNNEGGKLFADLTGRNVNEYMAVMLDETVNSAPIIQERIAGGQARITMGGGNINQVLKDARSLEKVLNHGAYKAPVYKVHDNEVGPTLGADSVKAGQMSLSLGLLLVIIFMAIYYRASGLIAVTALVLNVLLILVLLIGANSALTLPGMAGIILTIGMAVDANIIIFERIREEVTAGKAPRAAVESGFEKAWSTILDANVTTALAGFILLNYTSGPIRGFAVTLLMGIVCSVFTAVYVSRRVFTWYLENKKPTELSI